MGQQPAELQSGMRQVQMGQAVGLVTAGCRDSMAVEQRPRTHKAENRVGYLPR